MSPRNRAIRELRSNGYELRRNGSNHDIYYHPQTHRIIPLKRHDFDEADLRYIRKEIRQYAQED